MRIVHVTDAYLPRLGGIELHVHDLAEQQRRRGHDVTVVTGTPDGAAAQEPDVVRLGRAAWAAPLPRLVTQADVVHCHSSVVSPLAWAAARRASAADIPTVVTMHSVVQRSAVVQAGLRAVVAAAGPKVLWAAVSGVAARSLQPLVPRAVRVLPNGIDPDAWAATAGGVPRSSARGTPLTVVAVGRLAARKRVLPLVDVLADVRRRVDPALPLRAVLAGDGPQRDAVRQRLRVKGLAGWVEMPGRLTRGQLHALYAGADVFLAPARLESFGLAALEARCAGLAVVAMAEAGVGEFVRDGVEGRLVADDRDMAAATADLLADPVRLARMQAHNRTVPTTLGWSGVVDRCLQTYALAGSALPARATDRNGAAASGAPAFP
jgi:glycosyltransferase involved in cell wall biosynthesis